VHFIVWHMYAAVLLACFQYTSVCAVYMSVACKHYHMFIAIMWLRTVSNESSCWQALPVESGKLTECPRNLLQLLGTVHNKWTHTDSIGILLHRRAHAQFLLKQPGFMLHNCLTALWPGLAGWAGTTRNLHLLTPTRKKKDSHRK